MPYYDKTSQPSRNPDTSPSEAEIERVRSLDTIELWRQSAFEFFEAVAHELVARSSPQDPISQETQSRFIECASRGLSISAALDESFRNEPVGERFRYVLMDEIDRVLNTLASFDPTDLPEWQRQAIGSISSACDVFRRPANEPVTSVDLIVALQDNVPPGTTFDQPVNEVSLLYPAKKSEVEFILREVIRSFASTNEYLSSSALGALLTSSESKADFADTYSRQKDPLCALVTPCHRLFVDLSQGNAVSIGLDVPAIAIDRWSDEGDQIEQRLKVASAVANRNGMSLVVSVNPLESTVTATLICQAERMISASDQAATHEPSIEAPLQWNAEIRYRAAAMKAETQHPFDVTIPTGALETAEGVIGFREVLKVATSFITNAPRELDDVECSPPTRGPLSADAFRTGAFEVVITSASGPDVRLQLAHLTDILNNSRMSGLMTPLDALTMDRLFNAPTKDSFLLPADVLRDSQVQDSLNFISSNFQAVELNAGLTSDFAQIYSPEEQMEVVKTLLSQLSDYCFLVKNDISLSDCTLRIDATGPGREREPGLARGLFTFEIRDGDNIRYVGALGSKDLQLHSRRHSVDLENFAVEQLGAALTMTDEPEKILDFLVQEGVVLSDSLKRELIEEIAPQESDITDADILQVVLQVCRSPWVEMEKLSSRSCILRDTDPTSVPSRDTLYGHTGLLAESPVRSFRHALMLQRQQEQGENVGWKFVPTEAFTRRDESGDWLDLRVD